MQHKSRRLVAVMVDVLKHVALSMVPSFDTPLKAIATYIVPDIQAIAKSVHTRAARRTNDGNAK